MTLAPGTRIGPYEVVSAIGAGGMGEVYRGRDTKLGRDVAIKTLPALFAGDPERTARFAREAQLLAALNHVHIAGIYGLVEEGGSTFLILEYIDGQSLEERLTPGPLPVDDALAIARQVAEALEVAHEKGIIHRDLKPGNIMVTADGQAKVLDFGLARAQDASGSSSASAMNSPTLTFAATTPGMIIGTAAYMSPEQAKGRSVDRRADIWAFGVTLFEMLTGSRPFAGESISETMAAIIKDRPSWDRLPCDLPAGVRSLLERTLEKDPRQRLRDIGDARLALEEIAAERVHSTSAIGSTPRTDRDAAFPPRDDARAERRGVWQLAVPWTLAVIGAGAALLATRPVARPAVEAPPLAYTLPISGESLERSALPAISPDGRHVVFARNGTLWVRSLGQLDPRQLGGTAGAQFPFWSADSTQVAYLASNALWRIGLDGSQPFRIAPRRFPLGGRTPGGVWLSDDTLVFAAAASGTGLFAVRAQGGEFSEFLKQDPKVESDFHRPSLLPDGRSVLFAIDHLDTGADAIAVFSNGVRKNVLTLKGEVIDSPVYSPTGHILYHRETTSPGIWALPYSLAALEPTGEPFIVAAGASFPSMSAGGTLLYSESSISGLATLAWLDLRNGQVTPATTKQFDSLRQPRLSPDGRRVVMIAQSAGLGRGGVVVLDLQRQIYTQLASQANVVARPVWRDDRTVVFARGEGQAATLVSVDADGSGGETVLTQGANATIAAGHLVLTRTAAERGGDFFHMALPARGGALQAAEPLQQGVDNELEPALSPDGTLLAYSLGPASQSEVILRAYPVKTEQWQVSSSGGASPVWSRRGDALYYRVGGGPIMRVDVKTKPAVTLGVPKIVPRPSNLISRLGFDVSADGTRLLMVQEVTSDQQRTAQVAVVHNWLAALRK